MTNKEASFIEEVFTKVKATVIKYQKPLIDEMKRKRKANPYKILIATMLSARTQDTVTGPAVDRLFSLATTPQEMVKLPTEKIEKTIYPVGFYRNKAKNVVAISERILSDFDGEVPKNLKDLMSLKGVGRKTANLVLSTAFGIDAICVDTHMHRFFNRIGYVETSKPIETERALMKDLPKRYWIESNKLIVTFGQNICTPISPKCSKCPIEPLCPRIGVKKNR